MYKKLIGTLGIIVLLKIACLWACAQSPLGSIRSDTGLVAFDNKEEVMRFFSEAKVPIKVLMLKKHSDKNLMFAAYPYSGSDTIDLYWFVKYGEHWRVKMIFFVLAPESRDLAVKENDDRITVSCANKDVVSCFLGDQK